MNKRQEKKKFKRRWQQVFSHQYRTLFHLNVKPSRVKIRIEAEIAPIALSLIGTACGMEIECKFKAKEQEEHADN